MFRRRRPQSDFSAELQAHVDLEMDRLRAEGMSEEEAYREARRNVGSLAGAGERFYESTRWMWFEQLAQDSRHAFRRLRKIPSFTATVILTLALGIGATTSIFTLVNAVLLKSLPVSRPEELLRLGNRTHCCMWGGFSQSGEFSIVSYELYRYFRDHTQGFEELAAFQAGIMSLGVRRAHSASAAESLRAELVSGNYFSMFGIHAYAGRLLSVNDDRADAPPAAVMSYRLWQQKYALDPTVIGSVFNFSGKPFTIVGITPPGFYGETLRETARDFFLPLSTEPLVKGDAWLLEQPGANWLDLIGRMKKGANPAAIETQMRVELQQWLRSHSADMDAAQRTEIPKQKLYLTPGGAGITSMREAYEHWLQILMTVSGFVLLIVCANVATLMLVRGIRQRAQTSMSLALGAKPMRLVRQALTESLVLSLFGGAAGIAVAYWGTSLILHFAFPVMTGTQISAGPSLPVLLFAFGVSMLAGIAFGIAPAWMATRVDPIEALRGANRATVKTGSLPRRALVILQAALSLVLLSTAGLLTEALLHLEHQDFGFEQNGRIIANIDPVSAGYTADQLNALYERIRTSIARIPGVAQVAFSGYSPLSGDAWIDAIFVRGEPTPASNANNQAGLDRVSDGYFRAIGNAIVIGRPIGEQDTAGSKHAAVINEAFAKKFFKGQNPIGKHFGRNDIAVAGDLEVVGVARDARYFTFDLEQPVGALAFLPLSQSTVFPKKGENQSEAQTHFIGDIVVSLRPGANVREARIRAALTAVDPNLPVVRVRSLREQVAETFSQQRLIARITSLFGGLALVLTSIGIYGVTAYNAGSRRNEIGVRMALGAGRSDVLGLILRGAGVLIGSGLIIGLPFSLMAGQFLGIQLYGVNQYDPAMIALATLALACCALIAAVIPAIRASSILPIQALRTE